MYCVVCSCFSADARECDLSRPNCQSEGNRGLVCTTLETLREDITCQAPQEEGADVTTGVTSVFTAELQLARLGCVAHLEGMGSHCQGFNASCLVCTVRYNSVPVSPSLCLEPLCLKSECVSPIYMFNDIYSKDILSHKLPC